MPVSSRTARRAVSPRGTASSAQAQFGSSTNDCCRRRLPARPHSCRPPDSSQRRCSRPRWPRLRRPGIRVAAAALTRTFSPGPFGRCLRHSTRVGRAGSSLAGKPCCHGLSWLQARNAAPRGIASVFVKMPFHSQTLDAVYRVQSAKLAFADERAGRRVRNFRTGVANDYLSPSGTASNPCQWIRHRGCGGPSGRHPRSIDSECFDTCR